MRRFSVHCRFAICCCHGSLEKEVSIFFDFFGKLDVGVLFVKPKGGCEKHQK